MTKIFLHGIIGQIFGKEFNFKVSDSLSAVKAIDANRKGFLKKLIDLSKSGCDYTIIVNGKIIENENELVQKRKINSIHFIPLVIGYGQVFAAIAAITLKQVIQAIVMAVVMAAIQYATQMIMMALNKQPIPQQNIAVGGSASQIEARAKSFVFSNTTNKASQGTSVRIGYGLLKIDSNIIDSSLSSYSVNLNFIQNNNYKTNVLSDFITD